MMTVDLFLTEILVETQDRKCTDYSILHLDTGAKSPTRLFFVSSRICSLSSSNLSALTLKTPIFSVSFRYQGFPATAAYCVFSCYRSVKAEDADINGGLLKGCRAGMAILAAFRVTA